MEVNVYAFILVLRSPGKFYKKFNKIIILSLKVGIVTLMPRICLVLVGNGRISVPP